MRAFVISFSLAFLAIPLWAQDVPLASRDLPSALAERVRTILASSATVRFEGAARIEPGRTISANVAASDSPLTLAGRIEGDLVVVNGDVHFRPGAAVTGDVIVLDGTARGIENAAIGGAVTEYQSDTAPGYKPWWREEPPVEAPWERDDPDWGAIDPWEDSSPYAGGRDEFVNDAYAEFVIRTGPSYNRIEGLPIRMGPAFGSGGANPTRFTAHAIVPTEYGDALGGDDIGYVARLEQFLGGRGTFRIGASLYSFIDPIENWKVSDLEASLSAGALHDDPRDWYARTGWSAFARYSPPGLPIGASLALASERYGLVRIRDPFTLFGDDPWRMQPIVAAGTLASLRGRFVLDTRDDRDETTSGWYLALDARQGLGGSLEYAEAAWGGQIFCITGPCPQPEAVDFPAVNETFTTAFIDARLYNRLDPRGGDPLGVLKIRFVSGGSVFGSPLPAQFQHALGGAGTLPGYDRFTLDCGARKQVLPAFVSGQGSFFPYYGCDRFVLGQIAYVGDFGLEFDVGVDWGDFEVDVRESDEDAASETGSWSFDRSNARKTASAIEDDEEPDEDWHADFTPAWVVFFDAGRGWTTGARPLPTFNDCDPNVDLCLLRPHTPELDSSTLYDVGAGLLLGDIGFYAALPLTDPASDDWDPRFLIRLDRRF